MKWRDNLRIKAKATDNYWDWENWKRVKNQVNKDIRRERLKFKENEIQNVSNDTTAKSLWNLVKKKACWTKSLAPILLKCGDNEFTTSSVKMATILNEYFLEKVRIIKIVSKMKIRTR